MPELVVCDDVPDIYFFADLSGLQQEASSLSAAKSASASAFESKMQALSRDLDEQPPPPPPPPPPCPPPSEVGVVPTLPPPALRSPHIFAGLRIGEAGNPGPPRRESVSSTTPGLAAAVVERGMSQLLQWAAQVSQPLQQLSLVAADKKSKDRRLASEEGATVELARQVSGLPLEVSSLSAAKSATASAFKSKLHAVAVKKQLNMFPLQECEPGQLLECESPVPPPPPPPPSSSSSSSSSLSSSSSSSSSSLSLTPRPYECDDMPELVVCDDVPDFYFFADFGQQYTMIREQQLSWVSTEHVSRLVLEEAAKAQLESKHHALFRDLDGQPPPPPPPPPPCPLPQRWVSC